MLALDAALCLVLYGCAGDGDSGPGGSEGELLEVNAPLKEIVWNGTSETLCGIETDEERGVEVDPEVLTGIEFDGSRPDAVASAQGVSVGENLALDPRTPSEVYLPQPEPGQVRVVGAEDLGGAAQTFDVGVPPERVALDRRADVLLALSEDGRTVTRVELSGNDVTAERDFGPGRATLVETPGERSGARSPRARRAVRPGGRGRQDLPGALRRALRARAGQTLEPPAEHHPLEKDLLELTNSTSKKTGRRGAVRKPSLLPAATPVRVGGPAKSAVYRGMGTPFGTDPKMPGGLLTLPSGSGGGRPNPGDGR